MKWPQILTTAIVALIPKEGAQTEAELRPIGLTPVIYRVWMCIRKHCISSWIQNLHGPRILSAVDHAWNTRVEQELSRHTKGFFGVVYLDCSKCYERVPHSEAADIAIQTGCPAPIVNLVFGLYAGQRYISVHSAISNPCGGNSGLIAGCGFAVHILRAFLQMDASKWSCQIRTYVDDITISTCLLYTSPSPRD